MFVGVLTHDEKKFMQEIQTPHGKWWMPFVWCFNLIKQARRDGYITDNYLLKTLMDVSFIYFSQLPCAIFELQFILCTLRIDNYYLIETCNDLKLLIILFYWKYTNVFSLVLSSHRNSWHTEETLVCCTHMTGSVFHWFTPR